MGRWWAYGFTSSWMREKLKLLALRFSVSCLPEFERALIQERVKAGLRNARAKGKRLGRPPVFVSESKVEALRASGASWRTIAKELSVGIGTVRRAAQSRAKIVCGESFETGPDVLHV